MNSILELLVKAGNFVSNIGSMVMIPVILVIVGLFSGFRFPRPSVPVCWWARGLWD